MTAHRIEPRMLCREDAAHYCGIGTTLFDAMVKDGRLSKPLRVNGRVLWDRRKLDAALDALSDGPAVNDVDRLLSA